MSGFGSHHRKKRIFSRQPRNLRLPISLLLLVLLIVLCMLIPTNRPELGMTNFANPATALYTPLPTFTATPAPTRTHIGRIVYTCTRGDYNQICLVNADGTGLERLTTQERNDYYPVFSPKGGMFVFASNRTGGVFDLYQYIFGSGKLIQLTNRIGNVYSPDFSPDGRQVVFVNKAAEGPAALWVIDSDGQNPHLLFAGANSIVSAAWSPDGTTIAFAMPVDQPNQYEIFLLNADGTGPRRLSYGLAGIGGSLDWSPDGRFLLLYGGRPGDKDLYQLEVSTGLFTQLTNNGNNASGSYSPDGQWIAFNSTRNDDQADIYIMRADGSDQRRITFSPEPDWQPHWEP